MAIPIVDQLVNTTADEIADRANIHRWIVDADLRKIVTLVADLAATTQKVDANQLAAPKAAETLDLRCTVGAHRSHIADLAQSDLRGCSMDIVADHRLGTIYRLVEALSEWGHHGCSMVSLLVADHRLVMRNRIVTAAMAIVTDVRNADLDTKVAASVPTAAHKLNVHRGLHMVGLRMMDRPGMDIGMAAPVAKKTIVRNHPVEKVVRKATVDQVDRKVQSVLSAVKLL